MADSKSNDTPPPEEGLPSSHFGVAEFTTAPKSPPRHHIDAAHIGNVPQSKFPLISTLLSHLPLVASMSQYMNRPSLSQSPAILSSSLPITKEKETSAHAQNPTSPSPNDTTVSSLPRKRGRPRKAAESTKSMDSAPAPSGEVQAMQGIAEPKTTGAISSTRARRSEMVKRAELSVSSSAEFVQPKRSSRRNKGGLEAQPKVTTLQGLREYIRKEGSVYGASESMWADNFAFMVSPHCIPILSCMHATT